MHSWMMLMMQKLDCRSYVPFVPLPTAQRHQARRRQGVYTDLFELQPQTLLRTDRQHIRLTVIFQKTPCFIITSVHRIGQHPAWMQPRLQRPTEHLLPQLRLAALEAGLIHA